MKKLLLGFLLVVTAFLGANQLKINLYAETTAGVTYVTEGDRVYVHFPNSMSGHNIDLSLFSQEYELNEEVYFDVPENAITINFTDYWSDTLTTVIEINELGQLSLSHNETPVLYIFESNDNHIGSEVKDGSAIYFEIETPPAENITSEDFSVFIEGEKFFMHLAGFMGTGKLSNVIMVNSTELSNQFNTSYPTGVPFASIENAASINIGYQSGGIPYDNYVTSSPKKYLLNPTESYQFYLNKDANGMYISTDSDLFEGKWYVRTTSAYSPSAFIYFTTDRSPVLDGQIAFVSNISSPMPETQIRTFISAIDDYDGDISHLISYDGGTYESNRIANTLVPNQTYTVLYSVEDSSGNQTQLTVSVLVKDVTGPTFGIATPSRTVSYKDTFNVEGFKTQLLVSDNYSTNANITITVVSNTYTANKAIPGTYHIVYQAADQYNNTSQKSIAITVIDDIGPVFSGVSVVVKPVESVLTAAQVIAQVIASDEISGNVSGSIQIVTDNYTGNGATIGNYSIIVRATDSSGNETEYTITVQVRDSLPPVFYVKDGYFINVEDTVSLTIGDIITILERTGQLVISSTTNYTVLVNEYTGNEDIEGIYTVSIKFNSTNGTEVIKSVAVNVIDTTESSGTLNPETTFTDHVVEYWYLYAIGAVVLVLMFSKKSKTYYKKRG